jgi:hypothetical protein
LLAIAMPKAPDASRATMDQVMRWGGAGCRRF